MPPTTRLRPLASLAFVGSARLQCAVRPRAMTMSSSAAGDGAPVAAAAGGGGGGGGAAFANVILLSSLAGVADSPGFVSRAGAMLERATLGGADGQIAFVPTASYAPNPQSTRKPGDQRRRARADARKKARRRATELSL